MDVMMDFTDIDLNFASCCATLLSLPNSARSVLDLVHIVSMCQVLQNKAYDDFPHELHPRVVVGDYSVVCETSGVTYSQVHHSIRQMNMKYANLVVEVCHELRIPSFKNAWELEKCIRPNPTKASWPLQSEQRLQKCVRIVDAHLSAVSATSRTGESAHIRACLAFFLMQPHDMAISQVLLKLRNLRLLKACAADPVLHLVVPGWLPDTLNTVNVDKTHAPNTAPGTSQTGSPHMILLPPDDMLPTPSFKQYSVAEASIAYSDVLEDGLKHNCSSCMECRAQRQLKLMTLKKFSQLPCNWVDRMVPSTASLAAHHLHASIDREFIQHLCQQAGHHAELIVGPPVVAVPHYRRQLTGAEYSCQGTMYEFHSSLRFCSTCHNYLTRPKCAMPPRSVMNGSCLPALPEQIAAMTEINERLVSVHQAFAEIRYLPRGGQHQLKGSVVHVESDLHALHHTSLPRTSDVLLVKVKRNLKYAGHSLARYSDMQAVRRQMRYLKNTPVYREALLEGMDDALLALIQEEGGIDMNDGSLNTQERQGDDDDIHVHDGNACARVNVDAVANAHADHQSCEHGHEAGTHDETSHEDSESQSNDECDATACDRAYGEKYPTEVLIDNEVPPHVLPAMIRNGYNELSVAPCANNTPQGVLFDSHGAEKCFVHAFCGERMTTNTERSVRLTYQELNKHLLCLMDKRVAQRSSHIFFILRRLQLLKVMNETRVRIRQCANSEYTAGQVKSDEGKQRLERDGVAQKVLSSVRTTPAYMQEARSKAHAMLRQLGTPTWFYTFTCRGHRQKELVQTLYELRFNKPLSDEDYNNMSFQDVTHLMQKDAVTCARTFNEQLDAYIKYVLVGCKDAYGGVCDYFMMTEYQVRGDSHVHGIAWVPEAPKFGVSTHEEIVKYIDTYLTCDVHGAPAHIVSAQIHKHTDTCRKNKRRPCRFFFPKFPMPQTCILLPIKDGEMTCTQQEVCHLNYSKICKELRQLYGGEHSHGLRNTEDTRTFDEFLAHVHLTAEEFMSAIRSSLTTATVFLKRNMCDIFVNQYSRHGLPILGSNMDVQFILDPYAAVKYITSYMCKAQRGVSELLDHVCKQQDDTITDRIKSMGRAFVKGTSVCAQEAVNLVMGNNIMRSTRDCIFIPTGTTDKRMRILKSNVKLDNLEDDDVDIYQDGLLERFSGRPRSLLQTCLAEFAAFWEPVYPSRRCKEGTRSDLHDIEIDRDDAHYDPDFAPASPQDVRHEHVTDSGLRYRRRQFPKIIRYVNHPLRLDSEKHYREQCMLYVPWIREDEMKPDSSPTWEHWYQQNLTMIQSRHAEYECMKMDNIEAAAKQADLEVQTYGDVLMIPTRKSEFLAEKAILEALGLENEQPSGSAGQRLNSKQAVAMISRSPQRADDTTYCDQVARLNYEQRAYLNHIVHHCRNVQPVQVMEFLSGGAGVGKSVLIHALVQTIIRTVSSHDPNDEHEVDKPVVLTAAPTGTAAFGVKGQTLHSMFHLRPGTSMTEDLCHSSWQLLHNNFSNLKWLIIDEISLVNRGLLETVEHRLQQIMANTLPFGGVNVIFVGDLFQLRPAGGAWIFADKLGSDSRSLGGNLWKEHVKMFELHTVMRQKESAEFAEILNRIRMGLQTQDDLDKLSKLAVQQPHALTPQLCSTHVLCDAANQEAYERAKTHNPDIIETTIAAENTSSSAMTHANRIIAEQEAAQTQELGKLRQRLLLYVGQTVELTVNIDNEDGLTNGASGVIDHITWLPGTSQESRPHIIWMSFHEPERGVKQRQKFHTLKSKLSSSIPEVSVPIFVVSKQDTSSCVGITRTQFPLSPAHARTIHHVQGVTIHGLGYINWGKWKPGGLLYVALSRFTEMNHISLVCPLTHADVTVDKQALQEVTRLRQDRHTVQLAVQPIREARISHYEVTDQHLFVVMTHNVRSLKKHWRLFSTDYDLPMCDIVSLQETRLSSSSCLDNYNLHERTFHHDTTINAMKNPHGTGTYVRTAHTYTALEVDVVIPSGMYVQAFSIGPTSASLLYMNIYRSPTQCSTTDFIDAISAVLAQHAETFKYIICCGDFNIDTEAPAYVRLETTMAAYEMLNVVAFSTHKDGSILDHIWTTIPTSECRCCISTSLFSDHNPVWLAWESCPWAKPLTLPPTLHHKSLPAPIPSDRQGSIKQQVNSMTAKLKGTHQITLQKQNNAQTNKRQLPLLHRAGEKKPRSNDGRPPTPRLLMRRELVTSHLAGVGLPYVPPFMPIHGIHKTSYQQVTNLRQGDIDWATTGFWNGNTWNEVGGIACGEFLDMQMLMSLTENNLLCGSMLSLALQDIAQQNTAAGARTWVMPCTWATHLLGSTLDAFNHQECLDGMLRNRILNSQHKPIHVLIPICRNNSHYYLIYLNLTSRCTWVVDSLSPHPDEVRRVVSNLQQFVDSVWQETAPWSRSVAKCTQQSNGTECGVHCIVNAACLLSGAVLTYPESHLRYARQAIYVRMQHQVQPAVPKLA